MDKRRELQGIIDKIERGRPQRRSPLASAPLTASGAVRKSNSASSATPAGGPGGKSNQNPGPAAQCAACGHSFADHILGDHLDRNGCAFVGGCQCSAFQSEAQCNSCRHPQSAHAVEGCKPTGGACDRSCRMIFSFPKPRRAPKPLPVLLAVSGTIVQPAPVAVGRGARELPPKSKASPVCLGCDGKGSFYQFVDIRDIRRSNLREYVDCRLCGGTGRVVSP